VSSLPKIVTRQRRGCDLNPGLRQRFTKGPVPETGTFATLRIEDHINIILK